MEEFVFFVEHRPGRSHSNADALSRVPLHSATVANDCETGVKSNVVNNSDVCDDETTDDEVLDAGPDVLNDSRVSLDSDVPPDLDVDPCVVTTGNGNVHCNVVSPGGMVARCVNDCIGDRDSVLHRSSTQCDAHVDCCSNRDSVLHRSSTHCDAHVDWTAAVIVTVCYTVVALIVMRVLTVAVIVTVCYTVVALIVMRTLTVAVTVTVCCTVAALIVI
jgi:hypothetical protein